MLANAFNLTECKVLSFSNRLRGVHVLFNLSPGDKILDRSNLKQSADDNFKFDENSRKFYKRVENTVDEGEIARYEQFLLFPQSFQKACLLGASKGVIVWEWVNVDSLVHFWIHTFLEICLPVSTQTAFQAHGSFPT